MRGLEPRDDLLRTGPVGHRLDAGDEAAFLDDQFVVDGGKDGLRHGADSLLYFRTDRMTK
jgi:hypothetical protein